MYFGSNLIGRPVECPLGLGEIILVRIGKDYRSAVAIELLDGTVVEFYINDIKFVEEAEGDLPGG